MRRWQQLDLQRAAVPVWSALLALAVCLPLFTRGYVLSYDMVWVPRLDLDRPEIWGLGTGLPRAVPSDAVAALLGAVIPAAIVQRLVLFAALFLLAVGTARLLRERPLVAQLAAATLAVWNPFVAERLVLGQWPLLLACAAFPWMIDALNVKGGPRWSVAALALAATALTPATGVMGVILGVIAAWRRGVVSVVLLAGLVNSPWIVAGILHSSISRSDPAAVGLFELQPEGHFGRLGSALTLGGIWNTAVVPTSRTLWLAVLIAVVIGAVMVVGIVTMWRDDRRLLAVLSVAGGVGLAIALAGWLDPDLVARAVADVPAGGLIRDGTRWLALLVPLEAVAFGAGVHTILFGADFTAWEVPVMVFALALPVAAMPDLAWGVGGRLEPATYPTAWSDARRVIETSTVRGDILVLPFSSYRKPSWNHDTSVLDPAGRFFDRTTVTSDDLVARVVGDVPAGGLIRDGTRWLCLLVPLEAVAFGAGVHTILYRAEFTAWEVPVMVFALVLPIAAMPDLAWGVGGRLEPATYPTAWVDARRVIEASTVRGDIVVLPFSSYRKPAWNHDTSVLDPAGRYFDRPTVTNDDLVVSGRTIAGEDPRAARIQRVLRSSNARRGLARQGIGIVVVETDAPGARAALRQVRGARELDVEGTSIRVFALPGARPKAIVESDRQIMTATWVVAGLTLLFALVAAVRGAVERGRRKPVPPGSRSRS